jgi:hypothetical protein
MTDTETLQAIIQRLQQVTYDDPDPDHLQRVLLNCASDLHHMVTGEHLAVALSKAHQNGVESACRLMAKTETNPNPAHIGNN